MEDSQSSMGNNFVHKYRVPQVFVQNVPDPTPWLRLASTARSYLGRCGFLRSVSTREKKKRWIDSANGVIV